MKIIKPVNINLETLIEDNKKYVWYKNVQGKLTLTVCKGKLIRKYIPELYYFISKIILNKEKDYNMCGVEGYEDYVKVKLISLENAGISYNKARQIIHF